MKYFSVKEFDCKSGDPYPAKYVDRVLAPFTEGILDKIREAFGGPIKIVSGYRTPFWNHAVGGAERSHHVIWEKGGKYLFGGDAADIAPADFTNDKMASLRKLVDKMTRENSLPLLGGYGKYKNWVHVDMRQRKTNGGLYLWKGSGVGSEK